MKQILFAILLVLQMTPAKAAEIIRSTQGGWKWQRPDENGAAPPIALSSTATSTPSDPLIFGVSKPGYYNIINTAIGGWNHYTILYWGRGYGGINAMLANDSLGSSDVSGFEGVYLESKWLHNSNLYYTIVTTGFSNNDAGAYSLRITGPGDVTFYPTGVPEPSTWLLLILGVGIVGAALRRRSSSKGADALTVQLGLDAHTGLKLV